MRQIAEYINNLDDYIQVGLQINTTDNRYYNHLAITNIPVDVITAEIAGGWCDPVTCSTQNIDGFVQDICTKFNVAAEKIIVDTYGSSKCRKEFLPQLAQAAADAGVSFAHVFDLTDDTFEWGPIDREDHREAVITIWDAFNRLVLFP